MGRPFLFTSCRAGLNPLRYFLLVEHLGAEVGQCRPGDQNGRDKGEHAEDAHDGDGVTGFHIIDDVGCGFHNMSPMASLSGREGWLLKTRLLVKQLRTDVGECRPGD